MKEGDGFCMVEGVVGECGAALLNCEIFVDRNAEIEGRAIACVGVDAGRARIGTSSFVSQLDVAVAGKGADASGCACTRESMRARVD